MSEQESGWDWESGTESESETQGTDWEWEWEVTPVKTPADQTYGGAFPRPAAPNANDLIDTTSTRSQSARGDEEIQPPPPKPTPIKGISEGLKTTALIVTAIRSLFGIGLATISTIIYTHIQTEIDYIASIHHGSADGLLVWGWMMLSAALMTMLAVLLSVAWSVGMWERKRILILLGCLATTVWLISTLAFLGVEAYFNSTYNGIDLTNPTLASYRRILGISAWVFEGLAVVEVILYGIEIGVFGHAYNRLLAADTRNGPPTPA